ncbi:hypothetical protein NI17_005855 [Thermobifida halotolerans]|uniref:Uncharacterized protein n=1 Tax=Thermobifida halotolerans TaxID=483545 RepID=A0AA97M568_9ACTN|nr:hypothetical protein [Thermobifida halotolerans]UOE20725.1 hypothetical protein NI17_005855 [Thermobifida halotolerans]
MTGVSTSEHVELVADLRRLVRSRLVDPLVLLLGDKERIEPLRRQVHVDVEMWAAQLLGPDDALATRVAVRLLAALHPGDAPFDPPDDWWRTPLGRVVARRVGHTRERVSYSVAGAMLGITRQGVHDLVRRGRLARHPEGGVTSESVRDRLRGIASPADSRGHEGTPVRDGR